MKTRSPTRLFANILAGFGYTSVLLQWLWVSVLFLPSFLENKSIKNFLLPDATGQPIPQIELSGPPILLTIIAVIITVAVLATTLVILARLPATISRTGQRVTVKAASATLPILTRRQTLPAKRRRELTNRLVKLIKLLSILLPVCSLALLIIVPVSINSSVAIFIESLLAITSMAWFSAEYAIVGMINKQAKNRRTAT
jgi:hypothetical protein